MYEKFSYVTLYRRATKLASEISKYEPWSTDRKYKNGCKRLIKINDILATRKSEKPKEW